MIETLLAQTALPNLHPALVHFPIALVAVALLADLFLIARRAWTGLDRAGAALWALAALSAGAAYLAGEEAAEQVTGLSPAAEVALAAHEDAAFAMLVAASLLAAARLGLAWFDRASPAARRPALRTIVLVGALATQVLVLRAADLGGALVYRHGVAVEIDARPVRKANGGSRGEENGLATKESNAPDSPTLARATPAKPDEEAGVFEEGSFRWTPRAGDGTALGRDLEPLAGSDAVRVLAATEADDARELALAVSGRSWLALPGTWQEAAIEVRLDASGFRGSVGLAHRLRDALNAGLLRLGDDGRLVLVELRDGNERLLAEGRVAPAADERTLRLSATGHHWRAVADSEAVLHGHASIPGPGRAALLLEGEGIVRLRSVHLLHLAPDGEDATTPRPADRGREGGRR